MSHRPSKEELEAAARCQSKIQSIAQGAFIVAGSTLYAACGLIGRVPLMPKLVGTFAFASAGAYGSLSWSVRHCFEEFLTLDGSYLQEKLISILQNQPVIEPGTRAILEKYYYLESLYDDSGQGTSGIALRKREVLGVSLEKPRREEGSFSNYPDLSENADKSSLNSKDKVEPSSMTRAEDVSDSHLQGHRSNQTVIHDDAIEDPFKALLWGEAEQTRKAARKHTGRMRVLERREYNRARYLEWKAKRNASGWENQAEQTED
ncbi:hypothetical protein GOP47_0025282 [Adiantum capillus-veneris]|uniref:Uncharacterized protein n=1 Tax=Adiantum capillus-veneris TaxID=13818 RepID=A0A9D4U0E7_ADICA|nr:hypothetical protein GOP47_0025282 [Adiantum capillus-veneris]